jgi:Concanavalin A-like lectin/glucanases superfamily
MKNNLKKISNLLTFTIGVLIWGSCKKSDSPQTSLPDIPLSFDTTTVILNNAKIGFIKEVYPDYMIVAGTNLGQGRGATGNVSAINLHEQGIFVSSANTKFPKGAIEKISSITPYGAGDFKIGFVPFDPLNPQSFICDALEAGNHAEIYPVKNTDVEKVIDDAGNPFPMQFDGSKLKIEISKKWDWDKNPATKTDTVEIAGEIKLNLDLDVDIRVQNWKLEKFKTELKLKFDGEVKTKATLPFVDEKATFKLYEIYLKPIPVLIGGVFPVVLNPVVTINAIISAKGEVTIEGTIVKYAAEMSKGFEYTRGSGFSLIGTNKFPQFKFNPAITASYEGEFKVSPEIGLAIRLYNKEGIAVSAELGLYGKAKFTAEASTNNPNFVDLNAELKLGMEGKVKGKLKLFNQEILDQEISFTIAEITVWELKKFITNWNPLNTTNSLIAYYPFNSNAADLSGNNNNGTINGGVIYVTNRNGNQNSAMYFDGSSGYVQIPSSNSLESPSSGISISAWIKAEIVASYGAFFLCKSNTGNTSPFQYRAGFSNFNMYFGYKNSTSSSTDIQSAPYSLSENIWKFVTYTYDGQKAKFYIDGILVNEVSETGNIYPDNKPLEIGRDSHGPIEWFKGTLDEVRIYNRALTLSEINTIKNY